MLLQSHDLDDHMTSFQDACYFMQDDFAQNKEFITLVVYKTDGKKVYYPGGMFTCHLVSLPFLPLQPSLSAPPLSSRPSPLHRRHPHQQPPLPDQDQAEQRWEPHLHPGCVAV